MDETQYVKLPPVHKPPYGKPHINETQYTKPPPIHKPSLVHKSPPVHKSRSIHKPSYGKPPPHMRFNMLSLLHFTNHHMVNLAQYVKSPPLNKPPYGKPHVNEDQYVKSPPIHKPTPIHKPP